MLSWKCFAWLNFGPSSSYICHYIITTVNVWFVEPTINNDLRSENCIEFWITILNCLYWFKNVWQFDQKNNTVEYILWNWWIFFRFASLRAKKDEWKIFYCPFGIGCFDSVQMHWSTITAMILMHSIFLHVWAIFKSLRRKRYAN